MFILNWNNISQYFSFYCIFDEMNAALVSIMALFHCMVRFGTVHFWGVFHWVLTSFKNITNLNYSKLLTVVWNQRFWHQKMAHYRCNVIILYLSCSFETQRNGLVFIYDMAGSNYTNFELDLSKKILNLLKVRFVIHLCAVFPCLRVGGFLWGFDVRVN